MFNHYLVTSLRNLRRNRTSSVIGIVGLGVGLACFITTYGVANYLLSSDRQFANADRAYVVSERMTSAKADFDTGVRPTTSPLVAEYLRTDFPQLEAIARLTGIDEVAAAAGDRKSFVAGLAVDADFLAIFDFPFIAGGGPESLRRPRSVVLTDRAARELFGSANAVGKTVLLKSAVTVTVTGVLGSIPIPSQFDDSPTNFMRFDALVSWDVFDDLQALAGRKRLSERSESELWGNFSGPTYVLLPRDGSLTAETLRERLKEFSRRHVTQDRRDHAEYEFGLLPASQVWLSMVNAGLFRGAGLSITTLLRLLGTLVLAVACLNYANLAAAQATTRVKEVGLQRVVGATRMQIALQCFCEALLVTIGALLLALGSAFLLSPLLHRVLGVSAYTPSIGLVAVLLSLTLLVLTVAFLAACYPVWVLLRVHPVRSLHARGSGTASTITRLLVGVQFAVASLFIVAIVVIGLQNWELRQTALGASSSQSVVIANDLKSSNVDFNSLRTELLKHSEIEAVAAVDKMPWGLTANKESLQRASGGAVHAVVPFRNIIAGDFFSAIDTQVVAGRALDARFSDDVWPSSAVRGQSDADSTRIYNLVVDAALSKQLGWANPTDAVDQLVTIPSGRSSGMGRPARIVGVVADKSLRIIGSGASSNIYMLADGATGFPVVRIKSARLTSGLQALESVWSSLAPSVLLRRHFMDDLFEQSYEMFRRIGRIVTGIASLSLIVASVGLFGVAAFVANRRTHEIGVRKTLGARTSQIVTLLLRDFSTPVAIANIVIWPLAYVAMNLYLSLFVHRISLTLLPFFASLLMAVVVACVAVGGHALRAARLSPATVLRYE